MALGSSTVRIAFLALAGVAGAALLLALLTIVFAWSAAPGILVGTLVVVAIVVIAEVALLVLARPRQA